MPHHMDGGALFFFCRSRTIQNSSMNTPTPPITTLREAVAATLCFFDIFDYPLTAEEVWRYLWWPGHTSVDFSDVIKELEQPDGIFERKYSFFFLAGRSAIVELRLSRYTNNITHWRMAKKLMRLWRGVPYLKAVALCNLFSLNNQKPTSDIDVFVVAESGHIWSVRFMVTAITFLRGQWRHAQKIANKFCLSFYITESKTNLQFMVEKPYDIYLVYWIATLSFIYDRDYAKNFFEKNDWIKGYLPNFFPREEIALHTYPARATRSWKEKLLDTFGGQPRENVMKNIQLKNMQRKKSHHDSSVVVSDDMLKFHEHDRRAHFRAEFERRWQQVAKK